MKTLSFKAKILLLIMTPLILMSALLTLVGIYQAQELGNQNVQSFSNTLFNLRREELKNYTELAISAIEHLHKNADPIDPLAQEAAKEIIRNLKFGEDGYFFVYDYNGVNIAHPQMPELEGHNLWNLQDSDGTYLIRSLIRQANTPGGGYTNYIWEKPSNGQGVGKIGYSTGLDDWQWMVGTGLYIDDLENAIAEIQHDMNDNIQNRLLLTASLALACTLLAGFIGLRFTMSESKLADEKLKLLSLKSIEGQEEERSRVARELQGGINKTLLAARSKLKNISHAGKQGLVDSKKDVLEAIRLLDQSVDEIQRISGELRPDILGGQGLYAAVEALAKSINDEGLIQVTVNKGDSDPRLDSELETAVYRIVQEAMKNITLHAEATIVQIRLEQPEHTLNLTIQDNGVGFDVKKMLSKRGHHGIGFIDMRLRAEALGGTFSVFASQEVGTVIKVSIPG